MPYAILSRRPSYRRLLATTVLGLILAQPAPGAGPTASSPERQAEQGTGQHDHSQHDHRQHAQATAGDRGTTDTAKLRQIPDLPLLDQDGETIDFYSDLVADKVVAMNFIFTTCTTVCRPMGAIFAKLQRQLGERAGRDVHLISVSVDPVTDRPQRLKEWAGQLGAGPGWTLVTGDKSNVDKLLKSLEVFTPDFIDHSPTVLVGNARTGSWKRTYGLAPVAKLSQLIDEMIALDRDNLDGDIAVGVGGDERR